MTILICSIVSHFFCMEGWIWISHFLTTLLLEVKICWLWFVGDVWEPQAEGWCQATGGIWQLPILLVMFPCFPPMPIEITSNTTRSRWNEWWLGTFSMLWIGHGFSQIMVWYPNTIYSAQRFFYHMKLVGLWCHCPNSPIAFRKRYLFGCHWFWSLATSWCQGRLYDSLKHPQNVWSHSKLRQENLAVLCSDQWCLLPASCKG